MKATDKKQVEKLVSFFYEIGVLRKTPRSHQRTLLTNDPSDSIAAHSFRVAMIGYFLAKVLNANADKVLKMCLIHDIEEARSGDQNWVNKKYVKVFEEEIRKEQLDGLVGSAEMQKVSREYEERKTKEAKIAKDADLLDQIFLLKEYELQGNSEASLWLKPVKNNPVYRVNGSQHKDMMFFDLSRKLAKEAKKQRPAQWWYGIWTPKRR